MQRSATANARLAMAVIRNTSGNAKPAMWGLTWNRTTTVTMSRMPKATLPARSRTNDARYCVWLLTCAHARWPYARSRSPRPGRARAVLSTGSAPLDDQLALAAALHRAAESQHHEGPEGLNGEARELVPRRAALDQDVEGELEHRRKRRGDDQREGAGGRQEPDREVQAAEDAGEERPREQR